MRCRGQRKGCTRATEDASFERHAPERLFVYGIIFGDSRGGCCACCGPWAKTTNPKALAGVKRAGDPGTDQCYDETSTATVNHGRHRKEGAEGEGSPEGNTKRRSQRLAPLLRACSQRHLAFSSARNQRGWTSAPKPFGLRQLFSSTEKLLEPPRGHDRAGSQLYPLYVVGESRAPLFVTL